MLEFIIQGYRYVYNKVSAAVSIPVIRWVFDLWVSISVICRINYIVAGMLHSRNIVLYSLCNRPIT
jgi:hypothetical protein